MRVCVSGFVTVNAARTASAPVGTMGVCEKWPAAREACEVLIAFMGVPVVELRCSALGQTRRVKEQPRTRPGRLCASGPATSTLWNDGPTAISSVHECTWLETTAVKARLLTRAMRLGGLRPTPSALTRSSEERSDDLKNKQHDHRRQHGEPYPRWRHFNGPRSHSHHRVK